MWDWFSQTTLMRHLPHASKEALASQRFWDHMDRIEADQAAAIWRRIVSGVLHREAIDLSSVSYDGTNFYTFIDTFNTRCALPQRGKNKQGRGNLRQISYALFCGADGSIPLFYDCYEGARHDAKEFPVMVQRFHRFLHELSEGTCPAPDLTLIFDKGNNSEANFEILDGLPLHFVGSVKLDEHPDLARISNRDARFTACSGDDLEGVRAWRVTKTVYGKPRTLVVTHNPDLAHAQWLTLQHDLAQALEHLAALRQKLEDRARGVVTRGKAPTVESLRRQCDETLSRQHLKRLIPITLAPGPKALPRLDFAVDTAALHDLADAWLGKTLLVTDRETWDNERIVTAYRSQFLIEDVFKEMKDRATGSWWPLHHWTDSKIRVHALYCTLALLLRALLVRRLRRAGLILSMKRILAELSAIREVVNIYPRKRSGKTPPQRSVLTKTSELQRQIVAILGLNQPENDVLG
jgi:transposase